MEISTGSRGAKRPCHGGWRRFSRGDPNAMQREEAIHAPVEDGSVEGACRLPDAFGSIEQVPA